MSACANHLIAVEIVEVLVQHHHFLLSCGEVSVSVNRFSYDDMRVSMFRQTRPHRATDYRHEVTKQSTGDLWLEP